MGGAGRGGQWELARKDFGLWVGGRTCLELRGHWEPGGKSRVDELNVR